LAIGFRVGFMNTTGNHLKGMGAPALRNNTTGNGNTAIGVNTFSINRTGSSNIALGSGAGIGVTTASHVICIGAFGDNTDNNCYIGSILGQRLPEELPFSLIQSANLAPLPPRGGLKRKLSRWSRPATRSMR
jgi:hypothetical protein